MEIIYNLSSRQIEQLHQLYQKEWWTDKRSLDETSHCVAGSQICIACIDEQQNLMGFVRVLTDFTFKALIFDLVVAKPHRGKGLANKLLKLVKSHKDLTEVKHFEPYCRPELEKYYEQYGFSTEVDNIRLMRYVKSE